MSGSRKSVESTGSNESTKTKLTQKFNALSDTTQIEVDTLVNGLAQSFAKERELEEALTKRHLKELLLDHIDNALSVLKKSKIKYSDKIATAVEKRVTSQAISNFNPEKNNKSISSDVFTQIIQGCKEEITFYEEYHKNITELETLITQTKNTLLTYPARSILKQIKQQETRTDFDNYYNANTLIVGMVAVMKEPSGLSTRLSSINSAAKRIDENTNSKGILISALNAFTYGACLTLSYALCLLPYTVNTRLNLYTYATANYSTAETVKAFSSCARYQLSRNMNALLGQQGQGNSVDYQQVNTAVAS